MEDDDDNAKDGVVTDGYSDDDSSSPGDISF
jgi:hypothetical protein